ncbi:hypothetical protein [Bacillus cereus]|uniref:Uncharacterized protein n=1 Tax=Bacillus cereus TaxID=1396 RepID=A0A2A7I0L1_BACCE|nr:hypothetical protein [Bacillus cereus]PEC22862.1 hypothetical protein COM96_06190 [Bacillus cereus]
MDTTQSLLWIALPNGMTMDGNNRYLRLSVYVNPRLRSEQNTTLASFPDFSNWAYSMQPERATFSIEVDDGTQKKVVPAYRVTPPPIQQLWCSLFESNIPVHPHEFDDYSNRPIVSYPVKNVLEYLKNFYQKLVKEARYDLPCIIPPKKYSTGEDSPVVPPVRSNEEDRQEECVSIYQLINELVELHKRFDAHEVKREVDLSILLNKSLEEAKVEARRRRATGRTGDAIIPQFPSNQGPVSPTGPSGPSGPSGPVGPGDPRNHDVQDAFYRTMLFHYRPAWTHPKTLPDGPEAKAHFEKEIDFHQMLSALGDFPEILRRLGLIIDLYIPADSIPKTTNNPGKFKLRIVPNWSSHLPTRQNDDQTSWTEDYCPWTAYHYREVNGLELFTAYSSTNEIDGGILIPEKEEVELVQVDVDGAALKTLNLAATVAAQQKKKPTDKPIDSDKNSGVSPLRNGGISVVRNKNAEHLNKIFNRSNKLNQMLNSGPSEEPLYAEDLLRGYRLDVIDQNENRYSLHRRLGQYKILNAAGAFEIIDEGFIQPSVTSSPETHDPVNELYIHESLFTWHGWSLSAPRPGKSISQTASAPNPDEPETMPQQVNNTAMTRLGLETDFMVEPGTLPRLRFGNDYTFRVRTVDLAGNGPNLEEAKKIEAALSLNHSPIGYLKYLRFDPVNPPELVPRQLYSPSGNLNNPDTTAYAEGESLERLVIRSNYNKTTEEYAAANCVYQPFNDRHVAPPKASLQMIEEHGLLDEALDAKKSGMHPDQVRAVIQNVYYLATREAGSFNDDSLPSVRFIRTGSDPSSTDGYAVHTEKQLILPYLPDPSASGVVFHGLPGLDPEELLYIDLKSDPWYEVKPFRICIVEGSFVPLWDEKTRVLTIQLPKASIVPNIRVSSTFGGNLKDMGLLQWVKEDKNKNYWTDQKLLELENDILYGRTWLFTPFREITLVHAVQQPLDFPAQPTLGITARGPNSTEAYLFGNIYVHIPSTSKVDILAEWGERIDDITKPEPELEPVPFRDHVMELPIWLDHGKEVKVKINPDALRLEKNESRLVFDSKLAEDAYKELLTKPATPENQEQMNLASKVEKHGFGDTKYRRVRYKVRATTRFREYFSTSMPNEDLVRDTKEIEIDVLSSARPSKSLVKYVLPTFSWQHINENAEKVTSVRRGGVRVYLDRPWWSSGDGEMLGVVLIENKVPKRDEDIYSYLTFWGQDPIQESPVLPLPTIEDFKNYKEVYDVHLFELPNQPVKVVCFEVEWDSERKMWYCDLELDTGNAYYPFIRLALVRFQPNSLIVPDDLRISPVVLADIVQTAPDRSLTVTRDPNQLRVYNVSVSGVTYSKKNLKDNPVSPATTLMNVQVQRQLAQIEDETIGWEDVPNFEEIVLHPGSPDANDVVIWEGQVAIPEENQGYPLRLVVKEIDVFYGAQPTETYQRIVYMDIIHL